MKHTEPGNFLLSLAVAIAAETQRRITAGLDTGPALVFLSDPAQAGNASIWAFDAVEGRSTEVYSVLRTYGGPSAGGFVDSREQAMSIQCDTRGKLATAVLAQAYQVHEALLLDDGRPASCWEIPAKVEGGDGKIVADPAIATEGNWLVRLVMLRGVPGVVGVDEGDRKICTFNFDVRYERTGI